MYSVFECVYVCVWFSTGTEFQGKVSAKLDRSVGLEEYV